MWNDLPENTTGSSQLDNIVGEGLFDNPKPVELIKRCIGISDKNATVLDFFAGSGTTGQAVLDLNRDDGGERHFILCTLNETTDKTPNGIAYDVTSKRLKRIMQGECYDGSTDFNWNKSNDCFGDSLDVYEIAEVSSFESVAGQTPFDVIDETLYGVEKFSTLKEKVEWVCNHFEITQKEIENDSEWQERVEEKKDAARGN